MTNSWIWRHNNGTLAVSIDAEEHKLLWYDNPDCGCGDHSQEQTFEDFLKIGPRWGDPPEDVLAEMVEALKVLERQPDAQI
jgi:hypothetical protein